MNTEGIRRKTNPKNFMSVQKSDHNSYRRNFRRAKHALAYGAALLGAVAATYPVSIVTASLSPLNAQSIMVTPPVAIMPSAPNSTVAIPKEQCNFLFDTATEAFKKHGKDYVSDVTRISLRRFFESVPGNKMIDCAGPREIAWTRGSDYDFVIALADFAGGNFKGKQIDFRMDYGFRPTGQPANAAMSEAKPSPTPRS